jgi:hypothetical protein
MGALTIQATRKADRLGWCFDCTGPAALEVAGGFFDGCPVCTDCATLYVAPETESSR